MRPYQIGIYLSSRLYVELLTRIIQMHHEVEIINLPAWSLSTAGEKTSLKDEPQVVILPMLDRAHNAFEWAPKTYPRAKLLLFGEKGSTGYLRSPDKHHWEEIRHFGLKDLLREVKID
jgi:hypothetical protein